MRLEYAVIKKSSPHTIGAGWYWQKPHYHAPWMLILRSPRNVVGQLHRSVHKVGPDGVVSPRVVVSRYDGGEKRVDWKVVATLEGWGPVDAVHFAHPEKK